MKQNTATALLVFGALLLLIVLNLTFLVDKDDDESETKCKRSSYRATPYGTKALFTLLEESKYPVSRLERPFTDLPNLTEAGTIVLIDADPNFNPTPAEIDSLTKWIESGKLLIVVDRDILLTFDPQTKVSTHYADFETEAAPLQPTILTRGVHKIALSEFAKAVRVDSATATFHAGGRSGAVLAETKLGKGRVVFLADPYVVANNGIAKADNLTLALNLFEERPAGDIAFDEYHHGYGVLSRLGGASGGVLGYFNGTPIPWMVRQLGLILILLVFSKGRRFGRPLPPRRERRTTNLEFVSSMATITRLARATDLAMQNIYTEFRRRLCQYAGVPSKIASASLAEAAARRARTDVVELKTLLRKCEAVAAGSPASDAEMLKLVSRVRDVESSLKL